MRLYRRNRGTGTRRLFIASFILILVVVGDVASGGALSSAVRGVGAGFSQSAVAVFEHVLSSRAALIEENRTLTRRVAELEARGAALSLLVAENAALRALTRLAAEDPGVSAPVVSSLISSPYGTFLIGAGAREGVLPGHLVLTGNEAGSFVLGRVVEAGARVSLVSRILAPSAEVEAIIEGVPLVVLGQGGDNGRTTAPDLLDIDVGDPVFSPSLGGRAFAVVGAAKHNAAQGVQDIYVRLPADLAALRYVYVIPF